MMFVKNYFKKKQNRRFSYLFTLSKMYYYSKIHIIYLMNKYSFELTDDYFTKDEK